MKVTLNWLKQYVDFNWSPEELTERLTMLGVEVEGVQKLGGEFEGIVVAHLAILGGHRHREPHVKTVRPQQFTDGSLRRIELQRQRPKQLSSAPVHDAPALRPRN